MSVPSGLLQRRVAPVREPDPRRRVRSRHARAAIAILACMVWTVAAQAQPVLQLRRVLHKPPNVEAYFSATCSGQPIGTLAPGDLQVFDNGVPIDSFSLSCPNPAVRCAMSASLVFDASTSMAGAYNAYAHAAGHAFLQRMDGVHDQAAVLAFSQTVTTLHGTTTDTLALRRAVDSVGANGETALWDGLYAAVLETAVHGTNACRFVVVLSDGGNNTGSYTSDDVAALALFANVRVFAVSLRKTSIGFLLQSTAERTGGIFYDSPDTSALAGIFRNVADLALRGFDECLLRYPSPCADGELRTVDLSIVNVCNGAATGARDYTSTRDTSTFVRATVRVGTDTVRGSRRVTIPVVLDTPFPRRREFQTAVALVAYDSAVVRYAGYIVPPGSPLETAQISVIDEGTRIVVRTGYATYVQGYGTLLQLAFDTRLRTDSVWSPITITDWNFDGGCIVPVTVDGGIFVLPGGPETNCLLIAPPNLVWSNGTGDYSPNPFSVAALSTNIGTERADNVRFRLEFDTASLAFVPPSVATYVASPKALDPGQTTFGVWMLRALPRSTDDSVRLCVVSNFDDGIEKRCCTTIYIPRSGEAYSCRLDAPAIATDAGKRQYVNLPLDVTCTVFNNSPRRIIGATAVIELPPELRFAAPDAPGDSVKAVTPQILETGLSGSVVWHVTCVRADADRTVTVRVRSAAPSGDSSTCTLELLIPGLVHPTLVATCDVPDSLIFDDATASYAARPFDVGVEVRNTGTGPARHLTARLRLPPGAELAEPGDSLRRIFVPDPLPPTQPADPVPRVRWSVRYLRKSTTYTIPAFDIDVFEDDASLLAPDSARLSCGVIVPPVQPLYLCSTGALVGSPDSLVLDVQGTGVKPNPFVWRSMIYNIGRSGGRLVRASIAYPDEGLTLDPASPPVITLDTPVAPGDSAAVQWTFHVANSFVSRLPRIDVTAIDDLGISTSCGRKLPIAAAAARAACDLTAPDSIAFDRRNRIFLPSPFTVRANFTNQSMAALKNITATLTWETSTGADLIAFDPNFDNRNPKTLQSLWYEDPQNTREFLWQVFVANSNDRDYSTDVQFRIDFTADFLPTRICTVHVKIAPGILEAADAAPPVAVSLERIFPNPLSIEGVIAYRLDRVADVRLSVSDLLGREAFVVRSSRDGPGTHLARLDAGALPAGVYLVRLQTPFGAQTRTFVVTR